MKCNMREERSYTTLTFNTKKGITKSNQEPKVNYLKMEDLYNYASMFVTKTIHEGNYDEKEIELIGTLQCYIDSYITLMQSNYYTLLSMRGDNVSLFYLFRIYQILFTLQSMKIFAVENQYTLPFDDTIIITRIEKFSQMMKERLSKGIQYDWINMIIHPFILEISLTDLYYKKGIGMGFSYDDFYNIPHFQDEVIKRCNPKMIRTIQEEEKETLQKKSQFFLDFYEKMKMIEKRLDKEMLWVHGIFSYKLEALLKLFLAKGDSIDMESIIVIINSLLNNLIQDIDSFDHSRYLGVDVDDPFTMDHFWRLRADLLNPLINLL